MMFSFPTFIRKKYGTTNSSQIKWRVTRNLDNNKVFHYLPKDTVLYTFHNEFPPETG